MKNETDTETTIYSISRGFMILTIVQYKNNSKWQFIAIFRAYLLIILKALGQTLKRSYGVRSNF